MSVYFHSSFNLNRERLSGVLKYSIKEPGLNDEQIASKFGYKAPFTKRYKSWLKKCGLIKNSTKVELTDYGKVIYKNDDSLNKAQTLWYMHSILCHSPDNAEVWNFFYKSYLPKNKTFSKTDLSEAISMKLMPHDSSHFRKNAPMVKVITKVLIDSYLSEKGFGPLGIIKQKNNIFFNEQKNSPYVWNSVNSFSLLY